MNPALSTLIADIPDFPQPGVRFRDVAPLLAEKFPETLEALAALMTAAQIEKTTAFAGIEARGFIFAAALAAKFNKNLVLVRKSGKLPPPVVGQDYALEYGAGRLEMQPGRGGLMLVDDVLATGGTLKAAADLAVKAGYDVAGFLVLINLAHLNTFAWNAFKPQALITYND